ncbi:MAG: VWA domain-containing protein [Polyangiaceae bacterium]|nr:VWA domain-containing protein [Polyangiaceae bacterium]
MRFKSLLLPALIGLGFGLNSAPAQAQSCDPPKILFVMDASSSMNQTTTGGITKWDAVQSAAHAVFQAHGAAAQYGLMTFPGATGGCAAGDVLVSMAPDTGATIESTLANLNIPTDNATPAGQTLVKASQLTDLPDYVIFMTDGWQFCDIDTSGAPVCATQSDCTLMGASPCPSCNSCQGGTSDPNCAGQNADGCYCVRKWPVRGVEALVNAGVVPFVVGFGSATDVVTLNQAGAASGVADPSCDPNSASPSCYFQATSPNDLTMALDAIVASLVTETCTGDCGIEGTRQCTSSGWTQCDAPATVACTTACGDGTQTCVNGELGACEPGCATGGAGGGSSGGASSGGASSGGASSGGAANGGSAGTDAGGFGGDGSTNGGSGGDGTTSGGSAGSAGSGAAGSNGAGDQNVGDDGGCGCRQAPSAPAGSAGLLVVLGALLFSRRRRRA